MMGTEDTKELSHRSLQDLLPWFVNRSLPEAQLAQVSAHLRDCAQCRQDVEWQRSLASAAPELPAGLDMERALGRLMPRLEARPAPPQRLRALWSARSWMAWALAGQGALIAVLAVLLVAPQAPQPAYKVLGAAPLVEAGNMVVAFRPEASVDDLRRLAQANGARVVDGPTVTGAYVLRVDQARQAQVAAAFKADPAVLLAEPLATGSAQ